MPNASRIGRKEVVAQITILLNCLKPSALRFLIQKVDGGHDMSVVVEKQVDAKHSAFEFFAV